MTLFEEPLTALTPASLDRRRFLRLASGAVAGALLAACGSDDGAGGPVGDPVREFTIVAENLAWDIDTVTVPAGVEVTATIENRDRSVPHNLHIRSEGDPKSPLEDGPVNQTLRFTIDEPGSYDYLCDAHPMMKGTIHAV